MVREQPTLWLAGCSDTMKAESNRTFMIAGPPILSLLGLAPAEVVAAYVADAFGLIAAHIARRYGAEINFGLNQGAKKKA